MTMIAHLQGVVVAKTVERVVVALVTENVFHDEMKIGYAVAAVSLTCVVLGLVSILAAITSVRSLADRDDGSGTPAGQPA